MKLQIARTIITGPRSVVKNKANKLMIIAMAKNPTSISIINSLVGDLLETQFALSSYVLLRHTSAKEFHS